MKTEVREWTHRSRTEYQYDDAGNQTRTTDYGGDGNVTCDVVYENDSLGDGIGWKVYNDAGHLTYRFEVDRAPTGLEAENRMYDADGNLIRREVYFYDSKSRIKETQFFDEKNVLRGNAVYEWADGELTIEYFDLEGNLLEHPAA